MIRRGAPLVIAALFMAAPALASEEGGQAASVFWHVFNLVGLIAVIVFAARKPLGLFNAERRSSIESNLQASADLLSQSEARLAEWQGRADALDDAVQEVHRYARERAGAERERILGDARASAERIRRDAGVAVAHELDRARESLRAEAADLAVELAARLVSDNITEADRERLVDEFVGRVERDAAGGGG